MKNTAKVLGTIVVAAVVMITIIACGPPRLKGKVTIEGEPMLGNTLTANSDALGGSGIISYQWIRNGSTGITDSPMYTLQEADKDAAITVTVTRSDNSSSVTSAPVTAYGYLIGMTGPGGGIIFYRDLKGFSMTDTGETAYYLEAAPVNQGTNLEWASAPFIPYRFSGTGDWVSIPGTETGIGTGRKNTALILAVDANAPAALACNNYSNNGMNDWFFPSSDELNELYKQRKSVSISSYFWSSSQRNSDLAWLQNFGNGSRDYYNSSYKSYGHGVRAVRAF